MSCGVFFFASDSARRTLLPECPVLLGILRREAKPACFIPLKKFDSDMTA
jgi:hypothetical protein